MGFPTPLKISSVLVALEQIIKSFCKPFCLTISFSTNSAMGERQILPWQTNIIFIIYDYSFSIFEIIEFQLLFNRGVKPPE